MVLALLLGAGVALVYLRKGQPPEVARLLPESEAIVYLNLRPLRAATHFDRRPVRHDAEYQHFIDVTGIDFERDLDEVAFALSRQAELSGPNGPVAYSEIFSGSFDRHRLTDWLGRSAETTETYSGYTLYSVPNGGRMVRVVILSRELVAVSNTPAPEQIHSIVDHYRSGFLSSSEPTLLAAHYQDLPLLSLAWGIGQIGLPLADTISAPGTKPLWQQSPMQLLGFTLPFRLDATFVASLRWTGALRLRVEEIAPSEGAATASADALAGLLNRKQPAGKSHGRKLARAGQQRCHRPLQRSSRGECDCSHRPAEKAGKSGELTSPSLAVCGSRVVRGCESRSARSRGWEERHRPPAADPWSRAGTCAG